MLTFEDALTAQPLALRSGAMLRRRNFSQARTMAGPEIRRRSPTNARITCHHFSAKIPFAKDASAVPIIPNAIPMAAKIPANFPISNGCLAAGAGVDAAAASPSGFTSGSLSGIAFILSVACCIILASFSAAFLLIRFSTTVAILLYGDQNAWPMLIGLSTILVMTASHSTPALS